MFEMLGCLALIMICIMAISWSVHYIITAYQALEKDYQTVFLMAKSLENNILDAEIKSLSYSDQKIFFLNNQIAGKAHIIRKGDFFLWKYDNAV